MSARHELLLAGVARLFERHEVPRQGRTGFNVFTVLRSSSDEVNLHSRFLHALLDYRETRESERENLRDFLTNVACVDEFDLQRVSVSRERDNIDLLISNGEQAVVIENKIWAGDRKQQLSRYHDTLISQGYRPPNIHLQYLTPFGSEPSQQSIGNLHCRTVSYRYDLPPWLERCQQRAFDSPALRESIAQYRQLIHTMTGTDYSEAYMTDLKELCFTGDNLILTHDLSQAFIEAKVELVVRLWSDIEEALKNTIDDLPVRDPDWAYLSEPPAVRDHINRRFGSQSGLYYRIAEGAWLAVADGEGLWFGVSCKKADYPERHEKLRDALSKVGVGGKENTSPWFCYPVGYPDFRNSNHDSLRLLNSEESRSAVAQTICTLMAELWQQIKSHHITQ